jgi:hypothetical protein
LKRFALLHTGSHLVYPELQEREQQVYSSLLKSGFPFQMAVAHLISKSTLYEVIESELPWRDRRGDDQFLDIVAEHEPYTISIECKKTNKDAYAFLVGGSDPRSSRDTKRSLVLVTRPLQDSTRRLSTWNQHVDLKPFSAEAEFCIASGGGGQRLLEPDCRRLLGGMDTFAQKQQQKLDPRAREVTDNSIFRVHVPILVTNAPLYIVCFDSGRVSLDDASFDEDPGIQPVDYVRFTKAFSAPDRHDVGVRTVFVVRASALGSFLSQLAAPEGMATKHGGVSMG